MQKSIDKQQIIIAAISLGFVLLLLGVFGWSLGFVRQREIATNITATARIVAGLDTPVYTNLQLERFYKEGVENFSKERYAPAIDKLVLVVSSTKATFSDAVVFLLVAYQRRGLQEAASLNDLAKAPETLKKALDIAQLYPSQLKDRYKIGIIPGLSETYPTLLEKIKQQQRWAESYWRGSNVLLTSELWWDSAIEEWQKIYDEGAKTYLDQNLSLALVVRLSDAYTAKALYQCQIKKNYSASLEAINRAREISYREKLSSRQYQNIEIKASYIFQTLCQ